MDCRVYLLILAIQREFTYTSICVSSTTKAVEYLGLAIIDGNFAKNDIIATIFFGNEDDSAEF